MREDGAHWGEVEDVGECSCRWQGWVCLLCGWVCLLCGWVCLLCGWVGKRGKGREEQGVYPTERRDE